MYTNCFSPSFQMLSPVHSRSARMFRFLSHVLQHTCKNILLTAPPPPAKLSHFQQLCRTLISSSLECMYNVAQTDWFGSVFLGAPVVTSRLALLRVTLDSFVDFTAIFLLLPAVNHGNACLSRQMTWFCIHQCVKTIHVITLQ